LGIGGGGQEGVETSCVASKGQFEGEALERSNQRFRAPGQINIPPRPHAQGTGALQVISEQ